MKGGKPFLGNAVARPLPGSHRERWVVNLLILVSKSLLTLQNASNHHISTYRFEPKAPTPTVKNPQQEQDIAAIKVIFTILLKNIYPLIQLDILKP